MILIVLRCFPPSSLLQIRDRLPHLKAIIQYSPEPVDPQQRDEGVMSWAEFLEIGRDIPDYEVQWRIEQQKPGHCASLIYTSGTTGQPKVPLTVHVYRYYTCMYL